MTQMMNKCKVQQDTPRKILTRSYLVQGLEESIQGGFAAPCDFYQSAWWFQQHMQTAPPLMLKARADKIKGPIPSVQTDYMSCPSSS